MFPIPRNRWTLLALIWLAAGVYALVLHEGGDSAPPLRHFDKIVHFFLFFAQFRLAAQAYIVQKRPPPYRAMLCAALAYALASEAAQHGFTATRRADPWDAAADLCGAAAALWLARLRAGLDGTRKGARTYR